MSDVYVGLPRKAKIGQYTFKIVLTTEEKNAELIDCDGLCDFEVFKIYLDENLPRQRAINVVHHELTHAINWVYGIDDGALEEAITTQVTNGLCALWINNPKTFDWFVKSVKKVIKESAVDEREEPPVESVEK